MKNSVRRKLKNLKAVIFDFDGVMTDNRVFVSETGQETVACNRSDGMGIGLLRKLGVAMTIISTEVNVVVKHRANKLKLECHHGIEDKLACMHAWLKQKGISPEETAFVGNDVNDVECLAATGLGVVVADAYPEAVAVAKLVLARNGGDGAVREFCDMVRYAKGSKVK